MHNISIYISPELDKVLYLIGVKQKKSKSKVIREALEEYAKSYTP